MVLFSEAMIINLSKILTSRSFATFADKAFNELPNSLIPKSEIGNPKSSLAILQRSDLRGGLAQALAQLSCQIHS